MAINSNSIYVQPFAFGGNRSKEKHCGGTSQINKNLLRQYWAEISKSKYNLMVWYWAHHLEDWLKQSHNNSMLCLDQLSWVHTAPSSMLCSASKYGATYLSRILSARVVLSKVLASRIAMFDLSSRVVFLICVLFSILRFSFMLNEINFPWVV